MKGVVVRVDMCMRTRAQNISLQELSRKCPPKKSHSNMADDKFVSIMIRTFYDAVKALYIPQTYTWSGMQESVILLSRLVMEN